MPDDIIDYLETIELKTKMRGYDQIEVDEIFDRVSEEIKVLRESLKNSEEKLRIAEEYLDSFNETQMKENTIFHTIRLTSCIFFIHWVSLF